MQRVRKCVFEIQVLLVLWDPRNIFRVICGFIFPFEEENVGYF